MKEHMQERWRMAELAGGDVSDDRTGSGSVSYRLHIGQLLLAETSVLSVIFSSN